MAAGLELNPIQPQLQCSQLIILVYHQPPKMCQQCQQAQVRVSKISNIPSRPACPTTCPACPRACPWACLRQATTTGCQAIPSTGAILCSIETSTRINPTTPRSWNERWGMKLKFTYLFWEGHKIWKIDLTLILSNVKKNGRIFQNFVAFSEFNSLPPPQIKGTEIRTKLSYLLTSVAVNQRSGQSDLVFIW